MSFDFHKLKTISIAGGEVTLRIPDRWGVWPHETDEGRWGCFEKDSDGNEPDTGTVWVGLYHMQVANAETPPDPYDVSEHMARSAMEDKANIGPPLLESHVFPVHQGHCWFHVCDVEEGGDMLRFWWFQFFLVRRNQVSFISINLVLTHVQMNDPEFVELRDIMCREISIAFLDPFRQDDENDAERTLGPIIHLVCDGKVRLPVPKIFGPIGEADEVESDGPPEVWFEQGVRAGLDIALEQVALWDENDKTPVSVDPDSYEDVLRNFLNLPVEQVHTRRMPNGAVAYHARTAEPARKGFIRGMTGGRPTAEYRHEWWYMYLVHGEARVMHLVLRPSIVPGGAPPHPDLVAYMHRAVCRTEFLEYDPPEDH